MKDKFAELLGGTRGDGDATAKRLLDETIPEPVITRLCAESAATLFLFGTWDLAHGVEDVFVAMSALRENPEFRRACMAARERASSCFRPRMHELVESYPLDDASRSWHNVRIMVDVAVLRAVEPNGAGRDLKALWDACEACLSSARRAEDSKAARSVG